MTNLENLMKKSSNGQPEFLNKLRVVTGVNKTPEAPVQQTAPVQSLCTPPTTPSTEDVKNAICVIADAIKEKAVIITAEAVHVHEDLEPVEKAVTPKATKKETEIVEKDSTTVKKQKQAAEVKKEQRKQHVEPQPTNQQKPQAPKVSASYIKHHLQAAAEYFTAKGFQVLEIAIPMLESSKLVVSSPNTGKVIELYFDIKGKVIYNKQKMILVDVSELAHSGMYDPNIYVPELELGIMLNVENNELYAIDAFLCGATIDCVLALAKDVSHVYHLNKLIDFATIDLNQVSHALVERLNKAFLPGTSMFNYILSLDMYPRFRFENWVDSDTFELVSDERTPWTALVPKQPGGPTIRIRACSGNMSIVVG